MSLARARIHVVHPPSPIDARISSEAPSGGSTDPIDVPIFLATTSAVSGGARFSPPLHR